ncbi:hypothetical protein CDL15_Pgr013091 [Punica granatum]|uniref:Uncharacterized protein n=1 Tax=Punica granatum TaxID=22663 RepID=A0A218WJ87_PUNGR|nr:hypothetical protein CDL15_Pgr013091 [Punica granatum]PKI60112.1 hypothetical protein CRG98_019456 [Punica granatum]
MDQACSISKDVKGPGPSRCSSHNRGRSRLAGAALSQSALWLSSLFDPPKRWAQGKSGLYRIYLDESRLSLPLKRSRNYVLEYPSSVFMEG